MTVLSEPALDTGAGRHETIDCQLRPSGVTDPEVLAAFNRVAREDFVPASVRGIAYMDRAVPLGLGKVLAPPLTHGLMLQEAQPTAADRTLVVDGGSGYLAALVKPLVGSLDVVAPTDKPKGKGYTLMLIDGAIEVLPDALAAALADDGRVVTGLTERGVTRLAVGRKAAGRVGFLTLAEADFAPLPGFERPRTWSF